MPDITVDTLTETHHALLFAWIARAIVEQVGQEPGEAAVRKAVRRYGEQRGGRMALRAGADDREWSMTNFRVYGEWQASDPAHSESEKLEIAPDFHNKVVRCPWNTTWVEADLLPYGRLYCLEIDAALARGFNPDLTLEVHRTLANDGEPCEFVYREAGEPVAAAGRVRSWNYHSGHLYWTMRAVLAQELGDAGIAAAQHALKTFAERCGQDLADAVLTYEGEDFSRLAD